MKVLLNEYCAATKPTKAQTKRRKPIQIILQELPIKSSSGRETLSRPRIYQIIYPDTWTILAQRATCGGNIEWSFTTQEVHVRVSLITITPKLLWYRRVSLAIQEKSRRDSNWKFDFIRNDSDAKNEKIKKEKKGGKLRSSFCCYTRPCSCPPAR